MSRKLLTAGIVAAGTVVALLFGPNGPLGGFWRPIPLETEPVAAQLAGLIGAGLIEAIGFGAALALLVLGRPLFARLTRTPGRATVALLAAAWLLGSWWPHSALHMHFGLKPGALVALELIFHVGSVAAAALLLWAVLATPRRGTVAAEEQPVAARG